MKARTLALFSSIFFATAGAQAQTAISSTFHLGVWADANQHDGNFHQDFLMLSQGATLNPYAGSLSVTDADLQHAGRNLTVTSAASASWADAGHGAVAWRNMGWIHNTIDSSGAKLNGYVVNGPVWSYTFQATDDGIFSMDYDVRATGDAFGLLGARIEWSGPEGNLDLTNAYTPVARGTFNRSLVAGTTYTVGVFNMGNIFTSPLPNVTTGHMDADFNWSVGAVPEPSSLAAFGTLLAVVLKRRRNTLKGGSR